MAERYTTADGIRITGKPGQFLSVIGLSDDRDS